jgi:hypothetical protein
MICVAESITGTGDGSGRGIYVAGGAGCVPGKQDARKRHKNNFGIMILFFKIYLLKDGLHRILSEF